MDFLFFLEGLGRLADAEALDRKVAALASLFSAADDDDIEFVVHLCHEDWPWRYPKVLILPSSERVEDVASVQKVTVREVHLLVTERVRTMDLEDEGSPRYVDDELNDVPANWIQAMIQGNLAHRCSSQLIVNALTVSESLGLDGQATVLRAYGLCSDLGLVAKLLRKNGINAVKNLLPSVKVPVLRERQKTLTVKAAWEALGPCWVERKYDGYYCQVHKNGGEVILFSGKYRDWGALYPERFAGIIQSARKQIRSRRAILEAELVGYDPLEYRLLPRSHFWEASHYMLIAYEVLLAGHKDMTERPYRVRRDLLRRVVNCDESSGISLPLERSVSSLEEMSQIYEESVALGFEGIIAKSPTFVYNPGQRSLGRVKVKHRETVDAVIVGLRRLDHSELARQHEYLVAVYDLKQDAFLTVGYVSEGLNDADGYVLLAELRGLARDRKPSRIVTDETPDRWIEPKVVVEVTYDSIRMDEAPEAKTASMSLVGVRFVRGCLRTPDKWPETATEVEELSMYTELKHSISC